MRTLTDLKKMVPKSLASVPILSARHFLSTSYLTEIWWSHNVAMLYTESFHRLDDSYAWIAVEIPSDRCFTG